MLYFICIQKGTGSGMRIIGKSVVNEGDLRGKLAINGNIEIQLFREFDYRVSIDELYKRTIAIPNIRVLAVHSPIIDGEDVNIEFVDNHDDYRRIMNTIALANKFAEYYNETVKVIIHSALESELFIKLPSVYDTVLRFFEKALIKYPLVDICIENVVPVKKSRIGDIYLRNNCLFDGVDLVKRLNGHFKTDRFGTVLNTCHALVTIRGFRNYFKEYPDIAESFSLEDYFKKNKDCIKLIHLANVEDLGYNKGTHGILFKDEDMSLMNEIMDLYKKYEYDCDITIEILENDYIKNENYKDNYARLLEICKNKNILVE